MPLVFEMSLGESNRRYGKGPVRGKRSSSSTMTTTTGADLAMDRRHLESGVRRSPRAGRGAAGVRGRRGRVGRAAIERRRRGRAVAERVAAAARAGGVRVRAALRVEAGGGLEVDGHFGGWLWWLVFVVGDGGDEVLSCGRARKKRWRFVVESIWIVAKKVDRPASFSVESLQRRREVKDDGRVGRKRRCNTEWNGGDEGRGES